MERKELAATVYEYFPALARLRSREAGYLSGGERQMLAIGSALMCAPELLLVDELSLGLAPRIVEDLMHRLRAIERRWVPRLETALHEVEQRLEERERENVVRAKRAAQRRSERVRT